jgi:predicted dehydrogenase
MGKSHLAKEKDLAEVTFVGVADAVPAAVEAVSAEYGIKGYASAEDLIDRGGCEAVLIATPHPFHAPIARYAIERGLHVLSEKPIAVTVAEADSMLAAAERAGVRLGVMFQTRTEAPYRKARELLQSGAIGKVYRSVMVASHWFRSQAYYDSGSWRGTWAGEGGGVLMNQSPHSLDMFIWLGGKPTRVYARTTNRFHQIEVEDTAEVLLDYPGGQTGYLYTTTAEWPGEDRFEFTGELGKLVINSRGVSLYRMARPIRDVLATTTMWGKPEGDWEEVTVDHQPSGHALVVQQFARAIRTGEPLVATGQDGLNALELANAIQLSGHEHREVDLPLDRAAYDVFLASMRERSPLAAG